MYCLDCEYDLRGNVGGGVCPECGLGFDVKTEESYLGVDETKLRGSFWVRIFIELICFGVLLGLTVFCDVRFSSQFLANRGGGLGSEVLYFLFCFAVNVVFAIYNWCGLKRFGALEGVTLLSEKGRLRVLACGGMLFALVMIGVVLLQLMFVFGFIVRLLN